MFRDFVAGIHPDATMRIMTGDLKAAFAKRTGHRDPATAVIVWFARPNVRTALVATFRNGCFTGQREFSREMIESLILGVQS